LEAVSKPRPVARLALAAKVVVSVALLVYLSRKIAWPDVSARLTAAAPSTLVLGLALMVGTIFAAAWRWTLIVRQTTPLAMKTAVQLTFAGMFFGQALPATVGGDVVRGVLAGRNGLAWREVIASIVLDRITALLGSIILILSAIPWLAKYAAGMPLGVTTMISAGLAVLLAFGLGIGLIPLPAALARFEKVAALQRLINRVREGLLSKAGMAALGLSVLIHLTTAMIVVLIGKGFGIEVTPLTAFLVVPFAIFAAAIPISLNGWGVREGMMVTGLGLFGVAPADALLISVVLGVSVIIAVLPGSLTWLALR